MFQSLLEILPYYFAWIMAVILLVNVSNSFYSSKSFLRFLFVSIFLTLTDSTQFLQRSYGRPCLAVAIAMIGTFEYGAKIYYGDPRFDTFIDQALQLFPDTYTLGEALKVLRYGMPIILQATVLMMDNSFDVLPEEPDDPTKLLRRICDR